MIAMPGLLRVLSRCWARLKSLFDGYRPERHYMRGLGPKSRAKREATRANDGPVS